MLRYKGANLTVKTVKIHQSKLRSFLAKMIQLHSEELKTEQCQISSVHPEYPPLFKFKKW